jgi:hypothetical protein
VEAASPKLTETSLDLELQAKERCAIQVSIDGGTEWKATMKPGGRRNLKAFKTVQLSVDNAAALLVTRNGETLPPLGDEGEAKTIIYRLNQKE